MVQRVYFYAVCVALSYRKAQKHREDQWCEGNKVGNKYYWIYIMRTAGVSRCALHLTGDHI